MGSPAHHPKWYDEAFAALLALERLPTHAPEMCARRPTAQAERAAQRTLTALEKKLGGGVPAPMVFPTANQGVQFEWRRGGRELEIVFGPTGEGEFLRAHGDEMIEGPLQDGALQGEQISDLLRWIVAR